MALTRRRFLATCLLLAALALGAAACGDGDQSVAGDAEKQKPVTRIDDLEGVQTKITLDSGFLQELGDLGIEAGTVGRGVLKQGFVKFPITGGEVVYYDPSEPLRPYVQGLILHEGAGMSLRARGTEVELTDFVIDPGTSELTGAVSVDGELAVEDAFLFDLDGTTLNPVETDEELGTTVLDGTTVKLAGEAAELLDDAFDVDGLSDGVVVGIAEIMLAPPT